MICLSPVRKRRFHQIVLSAVSLSKPSSRILVATFLAVLLLSSCLRETESQSLDDDDDFDDPDEDFFPTTAGDSSGDTQSATEGEQVYDYEYVEPSRGSLLSRAVIQARGMMGNKNKNKNKGGGSGGGGGGGMNMSMMMINVTHDDDHYYEKDDDDKNEFEEPKRQTMRPRYPNCNFALPDKVIGLQKVVYVPRITVFDTDPDADVVRPKGNMGKMKVKMKKTKKKKCKKCKKKKKKGRRRRRQASDERR